MIHTLFISPSLTNFPPISKKTLEKTAIANNFLTDLADVFFFIIRIGRETFSRDFEFKEFLCQY
jgi:phospholipid/cholesterol/gamma-HCH transport system permease protein